MEGLIPMVYRAIKRSKTRSKYECLSSGAAFSYNIADFYVDGRQSDVFSTPPTEKNRGQNGHRRNKTFGGYSDSLAYSPFQAKRIGGVAPPQPSKQLVRFRSHRLFSCVTGA